MKQIVKFAAFASMGVLLVAQDQPAQNQNGMKARELFYSPAPDSNTKTAPPVKNTRMPKRPSVTTQAQDNSTAKSETTPVMTVANVPLGLRYSVLKRDASGKFGEVDSDMTFKSGDRIRLQVEANTTGYLYVVAQGASGNWQLLFPSTQVAGGNNQITKGQSRQIPPGDRGQFVFDEQAGTEKLFLVLSRQPEQDLDKLIYSINGSGSNNGAQRALMAKATVGDDVVNRLRSEMNSRDLVFEKVDEPEANSTGGAPKIEGGAPRIEKATYVVNPSRSDDARLVVDVALRHK